MIEIGNLNLASGNQSFFTSGLEFKLPQKGSAIYQFENLNFSSNFNGNRHSATVFFQLNQWNIQNKGSFLKSNGTISKSEFLRNQSQRQIPFQKKLGWYFHSNGGQSRKNKIY